MNSDPVSGRFAASLDLANLNHAHLPMTAGVLAAAGSVHLAALSSLTQETWVMS